MHFKKYMKRLLLFYLFCLWLMYFYYIQHPIIETFKTPDDIVGSIKVPPLRTFLPYLAVPLYSTTPRFIVNVPLTPLTAPLWIPDHEFFIPSQFRSPRLPPPQNQGHCGACWAFALTDQLTTYLLYTKKKEYTLLSPQYFLNCYNQNGCEGDSPEKAALWALANQRDIPSINDLPYTSETGMISSSALCVYTSGIKIVAVFSLCKYQNEDRFNQAIIRNNVNQMKKAILEFGSIYACMSVREDFFNFLGDIPYKPPFNSTIIGGHAIQIIGFTDKTWICRGAWPQYPLLAKRQNEFEIWMGHNFCGIESRCGFALAQST